MPLRRTRSATGAAGRNGCGRVPDASHTIDCEETDASRTCPQSFLPGCRGARRDGGGPTRQTHAGARSPQFQAFEARRGNLRNE
eukprot:gene15698-biopygen5208